MKKAVFMIGIGMMAVSVFAVETATAERLEHLGAALQDGGVTGMLSAASTRGWSVPQMPSKWHIETRMKNEDDIRAANAARDFGLALAEHLEPVAQQFQELPPNGELCARAHAVRPGGLVRRGGRRRQPASRAEISGHRRSRTRTRHGKSRLPA